MNAFVRKEVRLLLPSFVLGLLLSLSIWLFPAEPAPASSFRAGLVILMFMLSPAMLLMMTLGSFGRELSAGTFPFLLAQPVSRSRVWWTKTLLLAAAALLLWAAWWFSLSNNMNFLARPREDRREAFLVAALFVVVAYSGSLWTTLLFRQVAAAFWFTLLTPAAIAMAVVVALHRRAEAVSPALAPTLAIVLTLYGVAGFLFARRLFFRAQDAHWMGGDVVLPEVRGLAGWFGRRGELRQWRPRVALWLKEIQLHQSQIVLAGVLALMHLAVIVARKLGGDFKDSTELRFVLEQFWILWLAMPLLVGCTAVADERKLGTLEGQLCLPSRRRTQFAIKFSIVLLLSVLLGFGMPLLFEGTRILPDFSPYSGNDASNYAITTANGTFIPIGSIVMAFRAVLPWFFLIGIAASIGLLSLYSSSLARNTMQALGPAVLGILVVWFLIAAGSAPKETLRLPLWRGGLIYLIGGPVMLLALVGLMYWNFRRVLIGWPVWRRNLLVLLAGLAGIATVTSATYHRVWEHFVSLEPPHHPARLDQSVGLQGGGFNLTAQFRDGRSWSSRLTLVTPDWLSMLTGASRLMEVEGSAGYLIGTNWSSVGRSYRDVLGIQKDGSLWASDWPQPHASVPPIPAPPSPPMIRLGQDSDWKMCVVNGSLAFLLKTNGTLWRLGTNTGSWKKWPGFAALSPERLGMDSDWASVSFLDHGQLAFQKEDGHVWILKSLSSLKPEQDQIPIDDRLCLSRTPYFDGQKSVANIWTVGPPGRNLHLGVGIDGALRVVSYTEWQAASGKWRSFSRNIQLGQDTNWVALANNLYDAVALKSDGSLWKLNFSADPITKPEEFSAKRLSLHSDWVALAETMDGLLALAADGNLCYWSMDPRSYWPSGFTLQPFLMASRRPQLIGNVLSAAAP